MTGRHRATPFDFPGVFWFGWSLCWAMLMIVVGANFANMLNEPGVAWIVPLSLWMSSVGFVLAAVHARRAQHREQA